MAVAAAGAQAGVMAPGAHATGGQGEIRRPGEGEGSRRPGADMVAGAHAEGCGDRTVRSGVDTDVTGGSSTTAVGKLCPRRKRSACDDSSGDIAIYEEMLEAGQTDLALVPVQCVSREVIGARFSIKSTPSSKAARVDNSSKTGSRLVTRVSSPISPVVSLQPVPASTTIAAPKPSSPTIPPAAPRASPLYQPTIEERFGRFVLPPEVLQINALGTEGVIDTFVQGLAQASTASVCLLSWARSYHHLKQENESMHKELSAAQGRITAFEAAEKAFEANLSSARERATIFETELSAAHEKAAKAETELVKARERASLRETVMETEMKKAHDRACQADERAVLAEKDLANGLAEAKRDLENGFADSFIEGYEELRGKISSAFPDIDFSSFIPSEAPEDSTGYSDDGEDDGEEDDGGNSESD